MDISSECVDGQAVCDNRECERWSPWGPFTDCDATCGNGTRTRHRHCSNLDVDDQYDGCDGVSLEMLDCVLPECPGMLYDAGLPLSLSLSLSLFLSLSLSPATLELY